MVAIITKADVKQRLDQITGVTHDALLDQICLEIQDIIELYLGFTFAGYDAVATTRTAYGTGTPYLSLPPYQPGSVTSVVAEGSTGAITGWAEEPNGGPLYLTGYYPYGRYGWYPVRYTVTAKYGYGSWPQAIKQVAIEMAVNAFKERDRGHFSDIEGVQGAGGDVAVGYKGALLKRHKMILDGYIRKFNPIMVA